MPYAPRRFWIFYPVWIGFCLLLFLVLQRMNVDDPSRPQNRIRSAVAGEIAVRILERNDPRFAGYEVVNVAWARPGEVGPDPRWIVLADSATRTALDKAVVVELEPRAGRLIRIREVFR
ncbi:MAG: hypothetical protein ACRD2J_03320 [Thermoanaerobaculia bacterium]